MENVLELLKDKLLENSVEVEVDEEDGYKLRMTFDSMGDDDDGVILLEITRIPLENTSEYSFIHIFSVLAVNVEGDNFNNTLRNINNINLETLLGNYGIVEDEGILYHQYIERVSNDSVEKAVEDLYSALVELLAVIDADYNRVVSTIVIPE